MSKNELVLTQNDKIFTTSKILAEGFGIEHYSMKKTILKYRKELEKFGFISQFKIGKIKGTEETRGRQESVYLLNRDQAALVISFSRNTEEVLAFKVELVKRFVEMEKALKEKYFVEINTLKELAILKQMSKENLMIYSGTGKAEECKSEKALYLEKLLNSIISQTELAIFKSEMLLRDRNGLDKSFEEEIPMLEEDLE